MTGSALDHPRPHPVVALLPEYSAALTSDVPLRFRASSNESAEPPGAAVRAAVAAAVAQGHRYPAIHAGDLIAALGAVTGRGPGAVAVADGALSLLQHVLTAYVRPGAAVVHAWRSYEAYPICVHLAGGQPRPVPLTADHAHDLEAMLAAIDDDTDAVILCNPNNPTGTAFDRAALVRFLEAVPRRVLVILDEAYREFLDPRLIDPFEATDLLADHPHLLVLRTFSKAYALAGLRVGYLVADDDVASAVRRVAPPFPVSAPAVAAAVAALADREFVLRSTATVHRERDLVVAALAAAGYPALRSHANFVWLPVGPQAAPIARHLREHGIAIRAFAGEGARITVGEAGLAAALSEALASMPGVVAPVEPAELAVSDGQAVRAVI